MNSDIQQSIYCEDDVEYRVYCDFVINYLLNDFKKNHLKSGNHINSNRKRQQSNKSFQITSLN